MSTNGYVSVTDNTFIDTPSHTVDLSDGVVSNNSFLGGGYETATHADAISVLNTTGPVLISGNYIDWTNSPNALVATNNAIRITTENGNTSNVTVTDNIILGGQDSVYVDYGPTNPLTGVFSNINIAGNYIGDYVYSSFYPVIPAGVNIGANTDVGFDDANLSAAAWSTYLADGGVVTDHLVTATAAVTTIDAPATGTSTLYGNGLSAEHLVGGGTETIFIGGASTQYLWGGSGKNIYSYLAIADSTPDAPDNIGNFKVASDIIDLHDLSAVLGSASPVPFTFIGDAAFSGGGGQLSVTQVVASNITLVQADLVGDDSVDFEIKIAGLVNLTAANFALTAAQYSADLTTSTSTSPPPQTSKSVATFLAAEAAPNPSKTYSIVDSVANVQTNLAALESDAGSINTVTLSSGAVSVNAATFTADQSILNKIVGGFAVADTGANILSHMAALQTDNGPITTVTLTDSTVGAPDALRMPTANVSADAAILADIVSPYVLDATTPTTATLTGHGSGLTIGISNQGGGSVVTTATGGAANDKFYFAANFGVATVTDFSTYSSISTPDSIYLSTADFANWSTLLADGKQSGGNTVFTSADGARLTLDNTSLAALQSASPALQSEFKFHA